MSVRRTAAWTVALLTSAGLLSGCNGPGETPPEVSYAAADEEAFAQAGHDCSTLTTWYEHNPFDSNPSIARQYWDRCGEVPPPVEQGELAPWDEDDMFVAAMRKAFPEADHDESVKRAIPIARRLCDLAAEGGRWGDLVGAMSDPGDDPADSEEFTRSFFGAAAPLYCAEHVSLLDDELVAPSGSPDELVAEFNAELQSGSPASRGLDRAAVLDNADLTCASITSTGVEELSALWAAELLDVMGPMQALNNAVFATGLAVRIFCPDKLDAL